jgi:hypothetical protein
MNTYTNFLTMIATEFQKYLMDHERFADNIQPNALIIFQVRGEDDFNRWHYETSLRNREVEQPLVYVHVNTLRTQSLLKEVTMEKIAA